jgi:hypothetical protein
METKRSRYQSLGWRLARERIGQLVRENYRVNQEMSPRLAALIKEIGNGSAELSAEAKDKTISEKAAPGEHPAKARRIAANIAKLPDLLRKD